MLKRDPATPGTTHGPLQEAINPIDVLLAPSREYAAAMGLQLDEASFDAARRHLAEPIGLETPKAPEH